jgi:amino acid transporter
MSDAGSPELAALRELGDEWQLALSGRSEQLRALPVDPDLGELAPPRRHRGPGRFDEVDFVRERDPSHVTATAQSEAPPTRSGRALLKLKRGVLGPPLAATAIAQERMRKVIALPILSSDALSSVAYGPEAMLLVLLLAGAGALDISLYLGVAIVALMIATGVSYRQVIKEYPGGGGSYSVAADNLGEVPALMAGAGLLVDYVLTVAVSISAGVAAITSALPALDNETVVIGLAVIGLLLVANLRGVREAGTLFAIPTYAFVGAMFLLIGSALVDLAGKGFEAQPPTSNPAAVEGVTALLVLRAFSSGATAMTGIEAISNAVPVFKPTAWKNARATLTVMVTLLVSMFVGLIAVIHLEGIVPVDDQTTLSQLAHETLGDGAGYVFVQAATASILLLAANTAFSGFPRLLSVMAESDHAPRRLMRMGDRLVFSRGAIALAIVAAALFAAFGGNTNSLVPLYAIGVFVAFTCAQAGMIVHWRRHRRPGWRKGVAIAAVGATLSAIVAVVAAVTKFTEGAWVAVLLVAGISWLGWRIRRHYDDVTRALALNPRAKAAHAPATFDAPERDAGNEFVVVPVLKLDLLRLQTLAYATTLGAPVLAVHVSTDPDDASEFRRRWKAWGAHVPLEIVDSPYRATLAPLARYLQDLHAQRPEVRMHLVLPELVPSSLLQRPLHNNVARRLARLLRSDPGVVVTPVPFKLPR